MSQVAAEKKVLRVLHVGVGGRGVWPLEKCNVETGFRPGVLCDVSAEALAAARARTGLGEDVCYSDYETALREADVDCVIICVPTMFHVGYVSKAIEAGKPVLVEKGMAPDWKGASALAKLAAQRKAIACVAQNYRYNGMERTIREALMNETHPGHPGKVHLLSYTQNRVRPVPRTLTFPFASVWDMSCHHFDNMMFWLGRIEAMTAHSWKAHWSAYEYDNNTSAHIELANGAVCAYLHTHDGARANLEIQIHGERGALVYADERLTFNERPLENFGSRPIEDVPMSRTGGESDLLRDFHRYICEGVEPGISVRNNLETMAACEMMVRSISSGKTCIREELGK